MSWAMFKDCLLEINRLFQTIGNSRDSHFAEFMCYEPFNFPAKMYGQSIYPFNNVYHWGASLVSTVILILYLSKIKESTSCMVSAF